ncbi:NADH-quinone oxidoreductase subunit N [Gemmatimonas aurantiaca]|uniref:NADH-quinone oxidoreductase subunit N n=1 Tax=Gemmatimonas aurantiaca TaxID=173480 RepID=UPI00301E2FE4
MPTNDALMGMLPEHLLLGGIVAGIVTVLLRRGRTLALPVSILAVLASAGAAFWLGMNGTTAEPFPGQFAVTPPVLMAKGMLLLLAVPVLLMSRTEFEEGEFSILLLSSLYGLSLLPSATSALVLFLGLELMSIPVYALIVLAFRRPQSAESALKYLVLSGAASAMFLMGISLLYGSSGSMSAGTFAQALSATDALSRTAVVLVIVALFLKGAVVPFHAWAPDTYEGASIPVTAYMATLSKAGVLIVAWRLCDGAELSGPLVSIVAVLPLISIVWGNITAIRQQSLRRMIAYSSIAHAGYLFYALLGPSAGRLESITFYLVVYAASNLLAFAMVPNTGTDEERDRLDRLNGLFHRDPLAASLIAVAMLSLAGLPPLPGFTAKFLIFQTVVAAGYSAYAVLGLVGSFLGLYFYLRVIQRMFMNTGEGVRTTGTGEALARTAGVLCLLAMAALTIVPGWALARL